jgi:hypothetical protein
MTEQTAQKYINKIKELEKRVEALEQEPKTEWEHDHEILKAYADGANNVLDKVRAEILDTLYVDSLIFGELIDFRNGKISADDVIEEFNRVTRLEVLKIIDKYNSESEE